MVYMADPSPASAITLRCGHAMAAPTALGKPWPMAPPVRVSTSWRGAPAVYIGQHDARGLGLVDDDGVVRQQLPDGLAHLVGGEFAARPAGARGRPAAPAWPARHPAAVDSLSRLPITSCVYDASVCSWQPSGTR